MNLSQMKYDEKGRERAESGQKDMDEIYYKVLKAIHCGVNGNESRRSDEFGKLFYEISDVCDTFVGQLNKGVHKGHLWWIDRGGKMISKETVLKRESVLLQQGIDNEVVVNLTDAGVKAAKAVKAAEAVNTERDNANVAPDQYDKYGNRYRDGKLVIVRAGAKAAEAVNTERDNANVAPDQYDKYGNRYKSGREMTMTIKRPGADAAMALTPDQTSLKRSSQNHNEQPARPELAFFPPVAPGDKNEKGLGIGHDEQLMMELAKQKARTSAARTSAPREQGDVGALNQRNIAAVPTRPVANLIQSPKQENTDYIPPKPLARPFRVQGDPDKAMHNEQGRNWSKSLNRVNPPLNYPSAALGKRKWALFIIDPQNDFVDPDGALYVKGAENDAINTAEFIAKYSQNIDKVYVSLDTHTPYHIAHARFWINKIKQHPTPGTIITNSHIVKKTWMPVDPKAADWVERYTKMLEEDDTKSPLCIWPEHCLIGTNGRSVHKTIAEALKALKKVKGYVEIIYISKGSNSWTEHYSALKAEVEIVDDQRTSINMPVIEDLLEYERIIVCGQAKSHCVNFTVRDLESELRKDKSNPTKIVVLTDCTSNVPGFIDQGNKFQNDMTKTRRVLFMESTAEERFKKRTLL
jgi:nicotinamidase/pyrazinamidase